MRDERSHDAGAPPEYDGGPLALDGLAYGVDHLDAIIAIALRDARVHAAWVRADAGFDADDVATVLRDAYRSCVAAAALSGVPSRARGFVTLESERGTTLLQRVRDHVVSVTFDRAMPLGMARLVAKRIAKTLEPELPPVPGASEAPPPGPVACPPPVRASAGSRDREAHTLAFPPAAPTVVPGGSSRPPLRLPLSDLDRARRLLAFVESNAPDAHVVRLRVALRTGLSPAMLERPEALGAEAIVLIETAVEEILGVDRAELGRLA